MGQHLVFLGFYLPDSVTAQPGYGPPDAVPRIGVCTYCGRMALMTFSLGSGARICFADIADVVRRRATFGSYPTLNRTFDYAFWDRNIA